jgi:NADH:ubiquinone oxidoreductase subunit 6 (subunit J)
MTMTMAMTTTMTMNLAIGILLSLALASAFAAIALGRNWTRSIAAGFLSIAALGFTLLLAGAGFLGLVVVILAALMLGTLQLFGWMLVDVDRDHLPPTDKPTLVARGLAFLLLGGGLGLLLWNLFGTGEFAREALNTPFGEGALSVGPVEVGMLLFGPLRDLVILLGFAIAASLLATLLLLQDDEGNN